MNSTSFWATLAAAWIASAVGTLLSWLLTAGTSDAFSVALRRLTDRPAAVADPEIDGMVFVQLDGVPYPVMQWALQSGTMPTLRRWVRSGSHRLQEWTVQLPSTTPASQQGILHGTCDRIPAFRWYDRELGRLLVANRPADAAVIEQRASTGRGLLADDGISVSNLFSGDAPRSSMVMSKIQLARGSRETRRAFGRFVLRPEGFARSFSRTLAEVARERFQARRQRLRDVVPRVERSWTFAGLRAISNGLLRDINTAVVANEMMRGTKSIYVDYVDYDEVAHHAGGARLESLAPLEALDRVLAMLEQVAGKAPRRYHLVVLSDHGQSIGATFAERYGTDLGGVCAALINESVVEIDKNVESLGRAQALVGDLAGAGKGSQRTVRNVSGRLGRQAEAESAAAATGTGTMVLGSGNLGLVYLMEPERLLMEDIQERYPALLPGLVSHPGVGFVAVLSRTAGPVVLGAGGTHRLADHQVDGADPLEPFGNDAAPLIAAVTAMKEAPDIYVNSACDPSTLEVVAFEDLVGSHGGLGGWQNRGMLVAPVDLLPADVRIVGAVQLHGHLVRMLEQLGQRRHLVQDEAPPVPPGAQMRSPGGLGD
ncbi:alkaline phosphatase family protein [Arthrobacter sp. I2-34]|uniref:Alkaline phosphatase family protein n=1 Tax=Arthrobacter hankyongi TaxID=2904801 RepID=A0ABS9L5I5_9MICC|nr:alkaline phosphatase family protein [Arthrobacter hankyongi]MCG2621923.1 alkaline phosphatase family protein [Arthrobacter hankyongi]